MPRDPLESEIYKFRGHIEAAIVAVMVASHKVHPKYRDTLVQFMMAELNEIPEEVKRGGPPGRLPVREVLERLGIRKRV